MAQIISGAPIYETTEPGIVYDRGRRYGSRGSLLLFLVLIPLVWWIFTSRNFGSIGFGIKDSPVTPEWSAEKHVNSVDTQGDRQIGTVESTAITEEGPVNAEIRDDSRPVQWPNPQAQNSEIVRYAIVTAERVNMRERPGFNYRVTLVLPRGWRIAVLRQSHLDNNGETWIEVGLETDRGFVKGWIDQRYLAPAR